MRLLTCDWSQQESEGLFHSVSVIFSVSGDFGRRWLLSNLFRCRKKDHMLILPVRLPTLHSVTTQHTSTSPARGSSCDLHLRSPSVRCWSSISLNLSYLLNSKKEVTPSISHDYGGVHCDKKLRRH